MARIYKVDICRAYLDKKKYCKMPSLTLAKLIYSENIEVFTTVESVRDALRRLRGVNGGDKVRKCMAKDIAKYGGDNPGKLNPFPSLPKPIKHFKDFKHYNVEAEKMIILSDIHLPFQDNEALEVALKHAEEEEVDCILLNGDAFDFYSVSFHEKDPKMRDFAGEVEACKQFLRHLRGRFPDVRIIFKIGNHEHRFMRYMSVKAPELLGVDSFKFEKIFELEEMDIDYIGDFRLVKFQDYLVCHGMEFFGGGGAFPAKSYFQKAKTNIISAHLHRTSFYSEQDANRDVKRSYSSGCLCDMWPDYAPHNQWNHGFIMITKIKKDKSRVNSYVIEDGEII